MKIAEQDQALKEWKLALFFNEITKEEIFNSQYSVDLWENNKFWIQRRSKDEERRKKSKTK